MQNVLTDGISGKRAGAGGPSLVPFEATVSSWANLAYVYALLNVKKYDEYFGISIYLISVYPDTYFSLYLLKEISTFGITKVEEYLSLMYNSEQTNQQQGYRPYILKLKISITLVIKIAAHLMEALENARTDQVKDCYTKLILTLTSIMKYY